MLLDKKIPAWYFLKEVKVELTIVILLSMVIDYISLHFKHVLPEMPFPIPAFLGTAITILLSFKLNQSYDRWWEARKAWGAIVNDSRSLILQLQTLVKEGNEMEIKGVAYRQIAWCYALGQSLRGLDPLENTQAFLTEADKVSLEKNYNKPLAILQLNAAGIRELKARQQLDVYSHIQLDDTLVRLCDSMGKAERISSTIFPSTYRMLLHFIIYLFVVTLSFALKDVNPIFEIPLLILISICFFLLEKTASHLKNPFSNSPSDTPVTAIARNIEINIRQLLGETEIPSPMPAGPFYIL